MRTELDLCSCSYFRIVLSPFIRPHCHASIRIQVINRLTKSHILFSWLLSLWWKIKEERNNQTRNEWVRSILPVNLDAGAAHGFTWFAYNIQQKKEMVDMNWNHFSCLFTTREKKQQTAHNKQIVCAYFHQPCHSSGWCTLPFLWRTRSTNSFNGMDKLQIQP